MTTSVSTTFLSPFPARFTCVRAGFLHFLPIFFVFWGARFRAYFVLAHRTRERIQDVDEDEHFSQTDALGDRAEEGQTALLAHRRYHRRCRRGIHDVPHRVHQDGRAVCGKDGREGELGRMKWDETGAGAVRDGDLCASLSQNTSLVVLL